jgi:YidC/Oxa1 family membrane protein insertase
MLKTQGKQKNVQADLNKIKEQYKDDQKAQQAAIMELYKKEGINPLGSCLPMVIQIVLLFGFYGVFTKIGFATIHLDKLYSFTPHPASLNPWFFGADLTQTVATLFKGPVGWVAILFPVLTGLTQMYQSIQAKALQPKPTPGDKTADFSKALTTQMTYFMPLFIAYISYTLPGALSIYWITQTLAMIIQQHFMIKKLKDEEVVVEEIAEALEAKSVQSFKKGDVTVTVREKK